MSYWPGELVQTLSINGNQLSINPGNTVTLPTTTSSFTVASISTLNVSTINGVPPENLDVADFSLFPVVSTMNFQQNNIINVSTIEADTAILSTINVSTINGQTANFSTINTNILNAQSTIHSVSTISSAILEVQAIVNLSSINGLDLSTLSGAADWSLYPAQSTIQANSYDIRGVSSIYTSGLIQNASESVSAATTIFNANLGENSANLIQTTNNTGAESSITYFTTGGPANGADWRYNYGSSTIGAIFMRDNVGGVTVVDKGFNSYTFANNTLATENISSLSVTTSSFNTQTINTSSVTTKNIFIDVASCSSLTASTINGIEFVGGTGIFVSSIFTNSISTIGASIQQGLMSSIVFNPTISPQFNVDLGMGNFLTTLGTGLFGVAVAVPVTAGTITYGLTKGLASLFEPKPPLPTIAITSNFEVYNYQTQLQVSTLGHYVSTIYQFLSTIPSTIVINDSNINSTISFTDQPFFFSTISQSSTPTCIRSIADPTTTVSTPWTYSQSLPDYGWTELPSSIAGGGESISSLSTLVLSTLTLSTLQLSPSTILKGDLPQTLQVLSQSNTYNQVAAFTYTCSDAPGSANNGTYAVNIGNQPMYINSNFSTNIFALQNQTVTFSTINGQSLLTSGNIRGAEVIAIQTPVSGGSAFLSMDTSVDSPGDATLLALTSNAQSWGKFQATPGSNGVNIINAIGGFQQCLFNVGSNGAINFFDPASNSMFFSTNSLYVQNINGASYPPTVSIPANLTVSTLRTGQVYASTLTSSNTYLHLRSLTDTVELTPNASWFTSINSGGVPGNGQGKVHLGEANVFHLGYTGGEPYILNNYYPGSYDGGWINYSGRAVRVEYPILLDSSFPSGNGQEQFVLPLGLSTLASFQATYAGFQDNAPAFNHPAWLYSTINDANGQISTIQVGGEANTSVFVSVLGYV